MARECGRPTAGGSEGRTSEFRNLVGADDVLLAGILYRLTQDDSVEDALRFGLAAGLASAESDEKVCGERDRIDAEMARVTVKRI